MHLPSRILASLRDGSFQFKLLNRISGSDYIPGPEGGLNDYLEKHYPGGDAWKSWSLSEKRIWVQFYPLFAQFPIQSLLYVGANEGDSALALNRVFPHREFFLFEPVPQPFATLVERTRGLENMYCFNMAAGAKEERRDIFVDDFSQASSFLPYEPIALEEYPFLGKQHKVRVQVRPLDTVMREQDITRVDLLLMDVQGFENEVLEGAGELLEGCKVVITEMSLQELYQGSSTFDSIYQALKSKGFRLKYLINPMEGESRRILQIDGIFFHE